MRVDQSLKLVLMVLIVAFTGYLLHSSEENFFIKKPEPEENKNKKKKERESFLDGKEGYQDRLTLSVRRLYGRPPTDAEKGRALDVFEGCAERIDGDSVRTIVEICAMASGTRIRDALAVDELTMKVMDGSMSMGDAERRATAYEQRVRLGQ